MTNSSRGRKPSNGSLRSQGSSNTSHHNTGSGSPSGGPPSAGPPPLPQPISSRQQQQPPTLPPSFNSPPPPPPHSAHRSDPASQAALENWHVYRAATASVNAFANPGGVIPDDAYVDAPTPTEAVPYSPPGTPLHYTGIDTDDEDVRIAVSALGSMRALSSSSSSSGSSGSVNRAGLGHPNQYPPPPHHIPSTPQAGSGTGHSRSSHATTTNHRDRTASLSSGGHSNQSHSSGSHRVRTGSQHSGGSSQGKALLLAGQPSGIAAGASSRSTILGHMPPGPSSSSSSSMSYMAPSSRVSSHFSSASTMSSALSTPMSTPATEHTYLSGTSINTPSLLTADGPAPYRPLRAQASAGDLPFRSAVSHHDSKGKGRDSGALGPITLPQPIVNKSPPSPRAYNAHGPNPSALFTAPPPITSSQTRRRNNTASIHRAPPSHTLSSSSLSSGHGHGVSVPKTGTIIPGIRAEDTDMMPPPTSTTSFSNASNSRSSISRSASMASLRLKHDSDAGDIVLRGVGGAAQEPGNRRLRVPGAVGGGGGGAGGQAKGSGLRSMLVEAGVTAGGLSAAMSNESMKSLKYCLHWLQVSSTSPSFPFPSHLAVRAQRGRVSLNHMALMDLSISHSCSQYATARIEHQVTVLRDVMVKLNHGEFDLASQPVQNLGVIKGDVVTTIKGVVDVIGKYAGIALPEQARRSVKGFVLSLPARWASVNRIQTPAPRIAGAPQMVATPGGGGRKGSFGGSPASPSFGPEFSQGIEMSGSGAGASGAVQVQATLQAANRIITLAVESLDILRNVTIIFGESLDRADLWVERLRVVGLRRKRMHEQQEIDDADSAEAYMLSQQEQPQQQWYSSTHHIDGRSSSGAASGSQRGLSPSPPPGSVRSGRQLAPSPSGGDGGFLDAPSPVRPAHWELARGAAMTARAHSPSAESAVSMATTASSSKRRRTIGSANGGPGLSANRNRSSHSPGDGGDGGDGDSLRYERGSGAGSSQSMGRARGPNLSMTPTVRTPAGSDDESGSIAPGYRSGRSSVSYSIGASSLGSPPHTAGKISPTAVLQSYQAPTSSFHFKSAHGSHAMGPHQVPPHRRTGITTGVRSRASTSHIAGRSAGSAGRTSTPNTPASYTQPSQPE
ncbi:hypothetical protein V8E36_004936 [Tilletia maclaganii]